MSKIAILNIGAHGHINPTLSMTQELVDRGHAVLYATTAEFAATVALTGADVAEYESQFGKVAPSAKTFREVAPYFPLRLISEAESVLPQILAQFEKFDPDLVLYDPMCTVGMVVAQILGKPAATLCPSYAGNQEFSVWKHANLPGPTTLITTEFEQIAGRIAATQRIEAPTIGDIQTRAEDLNIVFVPYQFHPCSETFDERYVFVGPGFSSRPSETPWVPSTTPRQRRLFVSLGTVFNDWPEFFAMVAEAFGGTDWEVIMALGKRVNREQLGQFPDNIKTAPYWPQLDILPHCAAAVTHCGMGTTMEALSFGVPIVAIPQMSEQELTANRIDELRLGTMLTREQITVQSLLAAVELVTTDATIRSEINAMQTRLDPNKNACGYILAANAVEDYLDNRG